MRRVLAFALVIAAATTAAADDVLGPVDYLKILAESKLRYNILSEPSKTPAQAMTCPRRDERTRVKVDGAKKSLVDWVVKPEAMRLLEQGEAEFRKKNYDDAAAKYKAALAIDPEAVTGYYFYGDALLFGANDNAGALAQYQKGLALDPTMPSGHFFASTALDLLGRHDEAREEIIKALTYYPSYETVWKVLPISQERFNMKLVVRHPFEPPAGFLGVKGKNGVDIYGGPDNEWLGYAMCKAVWANEPRFSKQHKEHGWSLDEERACIVNQMMSHYNLTASSLAAAKKEQGVDKPQLSRGQIVAALPPLDRHLFEVAEEQSLDGYILVEVIGRNCPLAIGTLNDEAIKLMDGYIRKYLIVAR